MVAGDEDEEESDDVDMLAVPEPDFSLWRRRGRAADEKMLVLAEGGKAERMPWKDAHAEWKQLKKPCNYCSGHPHCGVFGHGTEGCLTWDGEDVEAWACVVCVKPMAVEAALLCQACGVMVHADSCAVTIEASEADGGAEKVICKVCVRAFAAPKIKPVVRETWMDARIGGSDEGDRMHPPQPKALMTHESILGQGGTGATQIAGRSSMTASTGTNAPVSLHAVSGLAGLSVVPKIPKDRPLAPRDFLVHNSHSAMPGIEDGGTLEVDSEGGVSVKKKRKERECRDVTEWGGCNLRLLTYLKTHGLLEAEDEAGFLEYHMRITELGHSRKTWTAVLEFDWMYRLAVHAGQLRWGQQHPTAYEAAFTDKPYGAALQSAAKERRCLICNSDEHNAGETGCIFRKPGAGGGFVGDGGDHGGGKGGGGKKGGKGSQGGGETKYPVVGKAEKGDVHEKGWWRRLGGEVVCTSWNQGNCTEPCSGNRLHKCSKCKGAHRSQTCKHVQK